jgi:hypothetical protein
MRSIKLAATALALTASALTLTATGAIAADANFGCIPSLARTNGLSPSTQAPGQTGNGPLVILQDGTVISANAFGGSTGC